MYWGNGQLQRHEWQAEIEEHTESYDPAGRLVEELIARREGVERSLLSYDAQGRWKRRWRLSSSAAGDFESVTSTVYDAAGSTGGWVVQLTKAPLDLDDPAHLDALKRAYERFPEIGGRSTP
ncbi:hypothetical protein MEBOL_006320 [Melittangium boletus DSM 14713]|uniref:YD repeat-containing protein n=2 Tax=Melittangium boletus TaxID=83453 RepID=A0A250INR7_9BACT|nr:hypothetical protein MEBOL_006320 [Melittangium boletus DSM 14713]